MPGSAESWARVGIASGARRGWSGRSGDSNSRAPRADGGAGIGVGRVVHPGADQAVRVIDAQAVEVVQHARHPPQHQVQHGAGAAVRRRDSGPDPARGSPRPGPRGWCGWAARPSGSRGGTARGDSRRRGAKSRSADRRTARSPVWVPPRGGGAPGAVLLAQQELAELMALDLAGARGVQRRASRRARLRGGAAPQIAIDGRPPPPLVGGVFGGQRLELAVGCQRRRRVPCKIVRTAPPAPAFDAGAGPQAIVKASQDVARRVPGVRVLDAIGRACRTAGDRRLQQTRRPARATRGRRRPAACRARSTTGCASTARRRTATD